MDDKDKKQYEKLLPKFNAKTLTKQESVSFMRLARIKEQEDFMGGLHCPSHVDYDPKSKI